MSAPIQRDLDIRLAEFSLLCGNLVWILPGSMLAALALTLALQDQLSLMFRMSWFGLVALVFIFRIVRLRQWIKVPATSLTVQSRLRAATIFSTCTATCFGALGFLAISPDSPLVSLLVVMVLTGMVASATASISYLTPMYPLYIFACMLPASMRMLGSGDPTSVWIGGLILLYLAVNIGSSRSIKASIHRSMELRFENVELLNNLKHQHHRAEIALQREEKANLAKSKFLAAASHDLRQPLHSLRLFTATLEKQTRNTSHKTLVSKIDSSVKSLEELFNALLDISKLDAGTIAVEPRHIYLDNLLKMVEGDFRPLALQKNLEFHVQLDNRVVNTDPLLLERLMRNLIGNAIRYTKHGSITISTTIREGRVWIDVKDTGVGIPEGDQARIFEEFVQLGNSERDRNLGIGLGLSIVKRLSDLLDLKVQVDSTFGNGATFRVGVPEGDESQCLQTHAIAPMASDHVGSLFVLVIDDEEEVCLAIEGLLETWGCIVMCATSADAAVQQLKEISDVPDVIVSDYTLRNGETGGDAVGKIRALFSVDLPAIILTGDIAPDRLIDINALGLPLLHKPCEPDKLRETIARETMPVTAIVRNAV